MEPSFRFLLLGSLLNVLYATILTPTERSLEVGRLVSGFPDGIPASCTSGPCAQGTVFDSEGSCSILPSAYSCDPGFCGLANSASPRDSCINGVFSYKGISYAGCSIIPEIDSKPICPTTQLNISAEFDENSTPYGNCECTNRRNARGSNYEHINLIEKLIVTKSHLVRNSDTWGSIATLYSVPTVTLLRLNGLERSDAIAPFCGKQCINPAPGSWVRYSGYQSLLPECSCRIAGLPTISENMMNCIPSSESNVQGVRRICEDAHPPAYATTGGSEYWEVYLDNDRPAYLEFEFSILSEITAIQLQFAMEIKANVLLQAVVVAFKLKEDSDFRDELYFADCDSISLPTIAKLNLEGKNCYSLSEVTMLDHSTLKINPWGPAVAAKITFFAAEGIDQTLAAYPMRVRSLKVLGRCICNGHASSCFPATQNGPVACQCEHNTDGRNCEKCLPIYNNKAWKAAESTSSNTCEICDCNGHSESCTYDTFKNEGVCSECLHNTSGSRCESCALRFYRKPGSNATDIDGCIPCACDEIGTEVGLVAFCSISDSVLGAAGQCQCKASVEGLKCTQCKDLHFGFGTDEESGCQQCDCYGLGSSSASCDNVTGQCDCLANYEGRKCDVCAKGYTLRDGRCEECNPKPAHPRFSDPETNACNMCNKECFYGCGGFGPFQCTKCRNFEYSQGLGNIHCVPDCVSLCEAGIDCDTYPIMTPRDDSDISNENHTQQSQGECRRCSDLCDTLQDTTCTGGGGFVGSGGCTRCAHLRLLDGTCLSSAESCPPGTFPTNDIIHGNVCQLCHESCNADKSCTGPSPGDCEECKFSKDGLACTLSCAAGKWSLPMPDGTVLCADCSEKCRNGCISPENITSAQEFIPGNIKNLIDLTAGTCEKRDDAPTCSDGFFYSNAPVSMGTFFVLGVCVDNCPSLSYKPIPTTNGSIFCDQCDEECERGCTGPLASDCVGTGAQKCKNFVLSDSGSCSSSCPPTATNFSWGLGAESFDCVKCSELCDPESVASDNTSVCFGPGSNQCIECKSKLKLDGACVLTCPLDSAPDGPPTNTTRNCIRCNFLLYYRAENGTLINEGECTDTCNLVNGKPHFSEVRNGRVSCIPCNEECRSGCSGTTSNDCVTETGRKCANALLVNSSQQTCVKSCQLYNSYAALIEESADLVCTSCPDACSTTEHLNSCCLGEATVLMTEQNPTKTCGYLSEGTCNACNPLCLGCQGPSFELGPLGCMDCLYYEKGGVCVENCGNGYFPNRDTKKCEPCASTCKFSETSEESACPFGTLPSQCKECDSVRSVGRDCVLECPLGEITIRSSTSGYVDNVSPLSMAVCQACRDALSFKTSEGVCVACNPQCRSGCTGSSARQCISSPSGSCLNYKIVHSGGGIECVEDCSQHFTTFPFKPEATSEGECVQCDDECYERKCTGKGPGNCLDGKCANYKIPEGQGAQSGLCVAKCEDFGAFYTPRQSGLCGICHPLCTKCTGSRLADCDQQHCTVSSLPNVGCVSRCPNNKYSTMVTVNDITHSVCESCHESCDANFGCCKEEGCGSTEEFCVRCVGFQLPADNPDEKATCVGTCPEGTFTTNAACAKCNEVCRYGCTGPATNQCHNPDRIPPQGRVFLLANLLIIDGVTVVDNTDPETLEAIFRQALGKLLDLGLNYITVQSMEPGITQGAGNALNVTYRVSVDTSQEQLTETLELVIPTDTCTDEFKCLSSEIKQLSPILKDSVMVRSGVVTLVRHEINCKEGLVSLSSTCMSVCGAGFYADAEGYCQQCHSSCSQCEGPNRDDCLGDCVAFDENGQCLRSCNRNEFIATSDSCQPCNIECESTLGCSGPGANECNACANFELDGTCYKTCPGLRVGKMCITECTAFRTAEGECLDVCPAGTAADSSKLCQACSTQCHGSCSAPDDATKCLLEPFSASNTDIKVKRCKNAVQRVVGGTGLQCVSACDTGYYFRQLGQAPIVGEEGGYMCKLCERGYSCSDGIVEKPCPLQQFTDLPGQPICRDCPSNAFCRFNVEKGSRDSFECLSGYTKSDSYSCVSESKTEDNEAVQIMIGVVAACAVLLACGVACFCLFRSRAETADMNASIYSTQSQAMSSVNRSTILPLARDYGAKSTLDETHI
eukprot:m.162141 g.162141  ORF g.162141 m.162141 type:complete len:2118 (-) comp15197_c1_seq1:3675-10028(-)